MSTEKFSAGGVHVSWDPNVRLLRYHYDSDTNGIGQNAVIIVSKFEQWIQEGDGPIAVISNGEGMVSYDALYRKVIAEFYLRHSQSAFIAIYNYSPSARVTAELWAEASHVNLKSFDDEGDCIDWLRECGFGV